MLLRCCSLLGNESTEGIEMAQRFARRLEPWISHARMEAHRPLQGDDLDMLVAHLHNMALCEASIPRLAFSK